MSISRVALAGLSATIAGSLVITPAIAAPQPAAPTAQGAAPATAVPAADVLDVDFSDGDAADAAHGIDPEAHGEVSLRRDEALGRGVARTDFDSLRYELPAATSPAAETTASIECTFRLEDQIPNERTRPLCAGEAGGQLSLNARGGKLALEATAGGDAAAVAETPLEPHRWYHATGVFDEGTLTLYLDGEPVATATAPDDKLDSVEPGEKPAWRLSAEREAVPVTFAGLRVHSAALTPAEVAAAAEAALPAAVTGQEPAPARLSPEPGARLEHAVDFELEWDNPELVQPGVAITVDGKPADPEGLIGPGLEEGEHELVISARTVFGRDVTIPVPFTSGAIPDAEGANAEAGQASATLSAAASTPDGGPHETTFYAGRASEGEGVASGLVSQLPETLEFDAIEAGDVPADGRSAAAHQGEIAFQRFDVDVDGPAEGQSLRWEGSVDPARAVEVRVWNHHSGAWELLASARGVAEHQLVLNAPLEEGHAKGGTVHALVTGVDPFADDLDHEVDQSFEDRDDYDFSIVHYTDTQFLAEGAADPEHSPEQRAVWQSAYEGVLDWIVENAEERNIAYAAHSGDIIENWVDPETAAKDYEGYREIAEREFDYADRIHAEFEKAGIPNGVLAGNHDNLGGAEQGADNLYNQYFGPERYERLNEHPGWVERQASFHPWREGDNDNHYDLFTADGLDFVVVYLSYEVEEEEAAWADEVLKQYADRNAIVVTHAYNEASTAPDGRGGPFSHDGEIIQSRVVDQNPNVALVLSGHDNGVSIVVRQDVDGENDSNVIEALADYQNYLIPAGEVGLTDVDGLAADDGLKLGASYLRLLQFDVERGEFVIDSYSPLMDDFQATEWDTDNRYDGREDDVRLPIQLTSRQTSFTTDSVIVTSPTDEEIGRAQAPSGKPAVVTWEGLEPDRLYAWYAVSRSVAAGEAGGSTVQSGLVRPSAGAADTTAPVLTVPGDATIAAGDPFDPLEGVSAVDDVDGDITDRVVVEGAPDTQTPGTYEVTYLVADAAGNQAAASRIVTVTRNSDGAGSPGATATGEGEQPAGEAAAAGSGSQGGAAGRSGLAATGVSGVLAALGIGLGSLALGGAALALSRRARA
ncbi:hypothetical protein HMPREF9719_01442 [Corynebacterium otitidis ATCC 51513]|uniref:LamG-like jellyroll fold domain-containing protein n=2 Tax=Corynebacterium otitidis TaxID=29321 RepID=K0YEC0_9CORY|nr:immunoglobulin-like domain-containing protein [Corynebacterium otitidis]EJZ81621.1 hypothetical protein HMPREF9719_01442 [Corynebacterium otitidis ATCC 51513]